MLQFCSFQIPPPSFSSFLFLFLVNMISCEWYQLPAVRWKPWWNSAALLPCVCSNTTWGILAAGICFSSSFSPPRVSCFHSLWWAKDPNCGLAFIQKPVAATPRILHQVETANPAVKFYNCYWLGLIFIWLLQLWGFRKPACMWKHIKEHGGYQTVVNSHNEWNFQ